MLPCREKELCQWSLTDFQQCSQPSFFAIQGAQWKAGHMGQSSLMHGVRSENNFLLFVLFCTFLHRHRQNCSSFSINMTKTSSIKKIATGNSVREETIRQCINHEIIRVGQLFMIKHWRVLQSCDLIASYYDNLVLSVLVSVINSHHSV